MTSMDHTHTLTHAHTKVAYALSYRSFSIAQAVGVHTLLSFYEF